MSSNKKRALTEIIEPTEEDHIDAPSPKRQKIDQNESNNNSNENEFKYDDDDDDEANEKLLVGPMSPRMMYRLLVCAEIASDICRDEGGSFTKFQAEEDFDAYLSDYLPVRFRKKMYKSFWM